MLLPATYDPPNGVYWIQSVGWPKCTLGNDQWNANLQEVAPANERDQWDVINTPEYSHISLRPTPRETSNMLAVMNKTMDYGSRIVIRAMDSTVSQQWIIYPGRKVNNQTTYIIGHATYDRLVLTALRKGCVLGPRTGLTNQEWWFHPVGHTKII
ncbi:hypothetical protein Q9L58_006232 [Maublancomyces gigas]|uniref:Ricin B lectin domain-containing protein n=1 Tax=Discina gigas TaxID=1032678 RepID=A0ABR3GFS4_9PEZI